MIRPDMDERLPSPVSVLLMPGLDGTGELFDDFLRLRPPGFSPRVVTYPEAGPDGAVVSRGAAMLDRDGRSLLIAESFSGPHALRLALAARDRVLAVVLCNSFVRSPVPAVFRLAPLPLVFRIPLPDWAVRRYLVGPDASDDFVARIQSTLRTVPPGVVARRVKAVLLTDVRRELRDCPVPVLYLRGTADRLVPERSVEEITAIRPEVVVRRIAGPHFLLQVAPARAWEAVQELLRGLF